MRVALFDNVNNNHYHLARFLRRLGVEADLYLPRYDYCMAQPEWEEGRFDPREVPQRYPRWRWLGVGWERPEWVKELPPPTWHRLPFAEGDPWVKEMEWKLNARLKWHQHRVVNAALRRLGVPELSFEDTSRFFDIYHWEQVVEGYEIVQVQSITACQLLAWDRRMAPCVVRDSGSGLRHLVFQSSVGGRLLASAYRIADAVVLTNPDTKAAAERLGLRKYRFIGYPVDEEKYSPGPSVVRGEVEGEYGRGAVVVFFPTRHDPRVKGTDRGVRAFGRLVHERKSERLVLVLVRWGEVGEVERLVGDLGIGERVKWLDPMGRTAMRDWYRAADVVLDQFVLGTPGRTCFEGMACGKPVVSSFDPEVHAWCYPEMPPLCSASTEEEILGWLRRLVGDVGLREELGRMGREWIEEHFSGEKTARAYLHLYEEILASRPLGCVLEGRG